ncbi:hypothetical protein [Rhodovulum viride]|uniref:hypothetical protein n=1 Tax=Rhodovulum viride TaxID=1231134 RepID=UPI0015EC65DE|nr:hypothetical protein [Rhodovulum viride]
MQQFSTSGTEPTFALVAANFRISAFLTDAAGQRNDAFGKCAACPENAIFKTKCACPCQPLGVCVLSVLGLPSRISVHQSTIFAGDTINDQYR